MFNMTLPPVGIGLRRRFHRVSDALLRVAVAMSQRRGRRMAGAVELGVQNPPRGFHQPSQPGLLARLVGWLVPPSKEIPAREFAGGIFVSCLAWQGDWAVLKRG